MSKQKNIQVIYKKLGKHKAHGFAYPSLRKIEIDERLKGKKLLEILTHEVSHLILPNDTEEKIQELSIAITNVLWKEGYRRTDNDNTMKLQDGTK